MALIPRAGPHSVPPPGPLSARRHTGSAPLPAGRHGGSGVPPAPDGAQHARRRATLAVICAAALIINVDNTILNVALPTLVRDLHATTGELQWIVDSYAMVFAGLLLAGGTQGEQDGGGELHRVALPARAWAAAQPPGPSMAMGCARMRSRRLSAV